MRPPDTPKRPQTVPRGVRFDLASVKRLETLARKTEVSFNQIVKRAIDAGLPVIEKAA